ncbi:SGS domain [Carpediemonas membranifera]|uniref:SGS domain n=1 Tax=Carpediemonas membranifera TaxID=201153 RepID=A0A8J6AXF3_9EUKA|nr:SGS domain [Carpediemonas membranifera]|eukprot:KAG9394880.1 SGS domain [Carpediemonas membranifera]
MPNAPVGYRAPTIRADWYQTSNAITISVFWSGHMIPEDALVQCTNDFVHISFPMENDEVYDHTFDLTEAVDPDSMKYRIYRAKLELTVNKKTPGKQWAALEKVTPRPVAPEPAQAPKKKTAKDWDELDKETKEEDKDNEDTGGDPLQTLFSKIYANADPDTQRAMMKSFTESKGTVLSTNWSEVGKGEVKPQPPSSG